MAPRASAFFAQLLLGIVLILFRGNNALAQDSAVWLTVVICASPRAPLRSGSRCGSSHAPGRKCRSASVVGQGR